MIASSLVGIDALGKVKCGAETNVAKQKIVLLKGLGCLADHTGPKSHCTDSRDPGILMIFSRHFRLCSTSDGASPIEIDPLPAF